MLRDTRESGTGRARQERDRASTSADNSAALIHAKLADEYERRAGNGEMKLHIVAR